jgi:ABC-type transport system substrate-binding protein
MAALESGRYEVFDRYGLPPSPDENLEPVKKYSEFQTRAVKGGTLKTSVSEAMDMIIPSWYYKGIQRQIVPWYENFLYEPLMRADAKGQRRTLHPLIAKAVRVDAGTHTYSIELRDDVKFSDGTPVRAENVLFSWNFEFTEINGPPLQQWYDRVYGKVELKVLSPLEVQVRFPDIATGKQREALWRFLRGTYIVKAIAEKDPRIQIPYPVTGTGPYAVVTADRDRLRLTRRKDYWKGDGPLFNFDTIETTLFRDRTVAREGLKIGALNFFDEIHIQAEPVLDGSLSKHSYVKKETPVVEEELVSAVLHMNMARPHLNDVRFRRAMLLAMDLEASNRLFYHGKLSPLETPGANSSLSPKGEPTTEELHYMKSDPQFEEAAKPFESMGLRALARKNTELRAKAREALGLLREAGYQFAGGNLIKDGVPVELTVLIWFESRMLRTVTLFKQALRQLGIELNFRHFSDTSAMMAEIRKQNYDFFPQDISIPRKFEVLDADDVYMHFSSDHSGAKHPKTLPTNFGNINSPAIDSLLKKMAETEVTDPSYKAQVGAFLRLLSANVPFILTGDRITNTYYVDRGLCLPPTASRLLEAAYFSEQCP